MRFNLRFRIDCWEAIAEKAPGNRQTIGFKLLCNHFMIDFSSVCGHLAIAEQSLRPKSKRSDPHLFAQLLIVQQVQLTRVGP
jgi:hypothetical protein